MFNKIKQLQLTPHNITPIESRLVEFLPLSVNLLDTVAYFLWLYYATSFVVKMVFFIFSTNFPLLNYVPRNYSTLTVHSLKYLSKMYWILFQSDKWLQLSFHRHIYKILVSSQLSLLCLWTIELFPFLHFLQNHFHGWYSYWMGEKNISTASLPVQGVLYISLVKLQNSTKLH